jgi:hypothetical protein
VLHEIFAKRRSGFRGRRVLTHKENTSSSDEREEGHTAESLETAAEASRRLVLRWGQLSLKRRRRYARGSGASVTFYLPASRAWGPRAAQGR